MLNKIKIAIEMDDGTASDVLSRWQHSWHNVPDRDVKGLLDWYKSRDLHKSGSKNIFRGLRILELKDYQNVKNILINKKIKLKGGKTYGSWTSDPEVAVGWIGGSSGIVVSKTLKSNDSYLDLNLAVDYLSKLELEEEIVDDFYDNECEIIAEDIDCNNCDLEEDIEVFHVSTSVYEMILIEAPKFGYETEKVKRNDIPYPEVYFIVKGNKIIHYSSKEVLDYMKRKKDYKCFLTD